MHTDDAVLHLAPTAAPLPLDAHRVCAALLYPRLVDGADSVRMRMLASYDLLATIAQLLLIPLDGLQKTL